MKNFNSWMVKNKQHQRETGKCLQCSSEVSSCRTVHFEECCIFWLVLATIRVAECILSSSRCILLQSLFASWHELCTGMNFVVSLQGQRMALLITNRVPQLILCQCASLFFKPWTMSQLTLIFFLRTMFDICYTAQMWLLPGREKLCCILHIFPLRPGVPAAFCMCPFLLLITGIWVKV